MIVTITFRNFVFVNVIETWSNFVFLLQVNSSLAFFLFSFQVHEKSILLAVLPASLLLVRHPHSIVWFSLVASFSMYPLLVKDGLALATWALCGLFFMCAQSLVRVPSHLREHRVIGIMVCVCVEFFQFLGENHGLYVVHGISLGTQNSSVQICELTLVIYVCVCLCDCIHRSFTASVLRGESAVPVCPLPPPPPSTLPPRPLPSAHLFPLLPPLPLLLPPFQLASALCLHSRQPALPHLDLVTGYDWWKYC